MALPGLFLCPRKEESVKKVLPPQFVATRVDFSDDVRIRVASHAAGFKN